MKPFQIHYDKDYGIHRRTGWSIIYDGKVVVTVVPSFFKAMYLWWKNG